VESEILALSDETFKRFISTSKYPHFLEKLKARKPYHISREVEKTLARLSSVFERPFELYDITKMLYIDFDSFEYKAKAYSLDYTTCEYKYEGDTEDAFRRLS